jgi:hypothetical protein
MGRKTALQQEMGIHLEECKRAFQIISEIIISFVCSSAELFIGKWL